MKRFALVLLLALVPLLAGAQSLVIPVYEETPGGTRKWVGQTQPMPVTDAGASAGGASTTAAITALAAQQASESLANLAAIATVTLDMASLSSDIGRVETETASGGVAVTAAVTAQSAQQATEALAIQAAVASVAIPISTPTTTSAESTAIAAALTAATDRIWLSVQNQSGTEEVTIGHANTITPGNGLTIFPGSSILRPWDSTVPVYFVSTTSASIYIEEASRK